MYKVDKQIMFQPNDSCGVQSRRTNYVPTKRQLWCVFGILQAVVNKNYFFHKMEGYYLIIIIGTSVVSFLFFYFLLFFIKKTQNGELQK